MNSDITKSVLRTLVPIIYALLLHWGFGSLGLPDQAIVNVATVAATGIVYVALRLVERYAPQLGWLLGYPAKPTYVHGEAVPPRHLGA